MELSRSISRMPSHTNPWISLALIAALAGCKSDYQATGPVAANGVVYEDDPSPDSRRRKAGTRFAVLAMATAIVNFPILMVRSCLGIDSDYDPIVPGDPGDTSVKPSFTGREKAEVAQWDWQPPAEPAKVAAAPDEEPKR